MKLLNKHYHRGIPFYHQLQILSEKALLRNSIIVCRSEELPSPIDRPVVDGRVLGRHATAAVSDTEVKRPTVSKVSSQSSASSLVRRAAMNEVRRAFFASASATSLDGAKEKPLKTTQSQDSAEPAAVRFGYR